MKKKIMTLFDFFLGFLCSYIFMMCLACTWFITTYDSVDRKKVISNIHTLVVKREEKGELSEDLLLFLFDVKSALRVNE